MGLIRNGSGNIQAFPLHLGTNVFTSGVTGYEIKSGSIIHMLEDGNVVLNRNGSVAVTVPAPAGIDYVIGDNIQSIDVDASCIIS
jgi:hypothetical protein